MSKSKKTTNKRKSGGRKLEFTIYAICLLLIVGILIFTVDLIVDGFSSIGDKKDDTSSVATDVESSEEISSEAGESSQKSSSAPESSKESSKPSSSQASSTSSKPNGDYINYTKSGVAELDEWYMVLVNRDNFLADGWTPSSLTTIGDGEKLDSRIMTAYNDLIKAAKKDGVSLWVVSSYRTRDTQQRLFNNKINRIKPNFPGYTQQQLEIEAAKVVARPRTSEHECGLAIDFNSVEQDFGDTKAGKWLKENCTDYGFVLRYEEDKQEITGVIWEPWHFRFVGVKHAKRMEQLDMCLEEYITHIKNGGN